mmetsp:Transcript_4489/g.11849  ORF Transcript_4489/g.11849 Transcript_4489/m.11849 type:complete len:290 (-) Transcript_4489:549-1418(-)|eukprot:CAMPEP_0115855066 /NCGR_PEP_ID=MMETSP0287-20121206/14353_1 /TAXON_ID=412157 /ORGANISM="Chrysochromulina rotalis, Strain UIO044" /LENGTH=289 /DNA_ID=CAMNT_0003309213 /DNA_START=187 /DNA_END=1056 /DNA_ORIENTATION=-
MRWHQTGKELLAQMDLLLQRRRGVASGLERAEEYLAEARAILAALRSALQEARDGCDPLGMAVEHAREKLQPNAASEAVNDLKDSEISALRALKLSPPANVRSVVCCACSLLKLHAQCAHCHHDEAAAKLMTWDEAQTMLASPHFRGALRSFDPRLLHSHAQLASTVREQLASLSTSGRSTVRRGLPSRSASGPALSPVVAQTTMLSAAVRSGGRSVGQLYLWLSRVLAESVALQEVELLEHEQAEESRALSDVLEEAERHVEECHEGLWNERGRVARPREAAGADVRG